MTVDGLPYVGQMAPSTPDTYIATGFGKWGMTNSMVAATILSDLITKGENPWQEAYNPSRATVQASAKDFVKENLDVAKNFVIGKALPGSVIKAVKPNEGKVVDIDGQRMGAYRDGQGQLYLVDTTCTHLGCELQWNEAENTWDCPCHGSRFNYKGDIIEGPAVKPLKLKTLEQVKS